jgi:hypothetical protein
MIKANGQGCHVEKIKLKQRNHGRIQDSIKSVLE